MSKEKKLYCGEYPKIVGVFFLNPVDWVFENGVPVRLKRKYGKFDRSEAAFHMKYKTN